MSKEIENLTDNVYNQIKNITERSAGLCGIHKQNIKGDYKEVLQALRVLYKQNRIEVKDGIQGHLIFLKRNGQEQS